MLWKFSLKKITITKTRGSEIGTTFWIIKKQSLLLSLQILKAEDSWTPKGDPNPLWLKLIVTNTNQINWVTSNLMNATPGFIDYI
jgi:hypothetical protein